MPRQDAYGRWISDDGTSVWDGSTWQPVTATASPSPAAFPAPPSPAAFPAPPYPAAGAYSRSSAKGGVALGFGIASAIFWLLPILGLPVSITALVVGYLSLSTSSRRLGRWGLILGAIGLVLSVINAALGAYIAIQRNA